MNIYSRIKTYFKKFFLINDTPGKVAGGAAVGVFMGIMPGEGVISTLVVASVFRFNRLSATTSILVFNMWTTFLVLPLAAAVGGLIYRVSPAMLVQSFKDTYHLGLKYFFTESIFSSVVLPLLVGYFIASVAIALAFFFLLYFLLKYKKVKFV